MWVPKFTSYVAFFSGIWQIYLSQNRLIALPLRRRPVPYLEVSLRFQLPSLLCRLHLVKCSPNGEKFVLGSKSHSPSAGMMNYGVGNAALRAPEQGSRKGRLVVWDLASMRSEGELTVGPEDAATTNSCALTVTSSLVVAGCADGHLRVYDLSSWWARVMCAVVKLFLMSNQLQVKQFTTNLSWIIVKRC